MFNAILFIFLNCNIAGAEPSAIKLIQRTAAAHGLSADDMYRIAWVESRFKANAVRKNRNGTTDIGMFQINSVHWHSTCRHLAVDTPKGNVECAALLLKLHRKYAVTDSQWIGRYHSKTPSKKRTYIKLLQRAPAFVADNN